MTSIPTFDFNNPLIQARTLETLWLQGCSYEDFLGRLYDDIDQACSLIMEDVEKHLKLTETEISSSIWLYLKGCKIYQVEKDTDANGNVDIIVRTDRHKWFAEAKIWSSNSYLKEGYLQLTERYSKGEKKNNHGGMFIYIKPESDQDNEEEIIASWKEYLKTTFSYLEIYDCSLDDSRFFSKGKHSGTKHDYHVRYIPITLLHIPRDKSGRTAQKYQERTITFDENTAKNSEAKSI
ncbi:hypothetical protein [Acinetobacter sp. YH12140]|uniref:hypothetical protein n=1 Tax=Acinetobacter sp. YH12140 TaxID=2601124 RepID=UPI0015D2F3D8|nr:hypothetical protein [Acinetobacter sp. YH12140]